MNETVEIFLGLGSNVGDSSRQLEEARRQLVATGVLQAEGVACSSHYHSPALLPEDAPLSWDVPFRNAVLRGKTSCTPEVLLEKLKAVEVAMGRQARGVWGPREIDIDILSYGNEVLQSQRLTIPHPQIEQRDFVLLPLQEIAPDWVHPVNQQSIAQLVSALPEVTAYRVEPLQETSYG